MIHESSAGRATEHGTKKASSITKEKKRANNRTNQSQIGENNEVKVEKREALVASVLRGGVRFSLVLIVAVEPPDEPFRRSDWVVS